MIKDQYQSGLATDQCNENTFESWKKFVLGQNKSSEISLPFAYKDSNHSQTSASGAQNAWLKFPSWANQSLGFGTSSEANNSWWEYLGLNRTQRYIGFAICIGGATILFMLSMMYLPFAMIRPSKFAAPYCFASLLVFSSFGFIHGFVSYGHHLVSKDRLPFTLLFIGTTIMTLYSATKNLGYILTVISVLAQLVCLIVYVVSYIPGGQSGITFMSTVVGSTIRSRFTGN